MPKIFFLFFLLVSVVPIVTRGEGDARARPATTGEESKSAPAKRFTEAQLSRVVGWIRERAPNCPPDAMMGAAERFLEELAARNPTELDRLSGDGLTSPRFESMLLRQIAVSIAGPQHAALRDELALKRIEANLAADASPGSANPVRAGELIAKIKSLSLVQHRRLVEGRMEDDDLSLLLKRVRSPEGVTAVKPSGPKVLSATDVVSEFRRHNQTGSSLQRLKAYVVEAILHTATGENQHLVLTRLIPDRFRLSVKSTGETQMILAFNGSTFWQQLPAHKAVELTRTEMGTKAYLAEFINPLFSDENHTFEKLEDGLADGIKVHRLRVRRDDGSNYLSLIDGEKFREVGREEAGGAKVSYSDFREIAGITFAFRESVQDEQGRTAVLEFQRIAPNPGVVQGYFEPVEQGELNCFAVERWIRKPAEGTAIAR